MFSGEGREFYLGNESQGNAGRGTGERINNTKDAKSQREHYFMFA